MKSHASLLVAILFQSIALCEAEGRLKIACLGDSITSGARVDQNTQSYPARLQRILGDAFTVRNFGIGGATLIKVGRPNVWRQLDTVIGYEPDLVVIALGTNDTVSGSRRNWERIDGFETDFQELIDVLAQLPNRPKILLATPTAMVLDTDGLSDSRRQNLMERKPRLQNLCERIRAIAGRNAENRVTLMELNPILEGRPDLVTDGDGVHPNAAGYLAIAEFVAETIRGVLKPDPLGVATGSRRPIHFSEHLIAAGYAYAYGIAAADLDHDGDLDLTSSDYRPHNCVYRFENNGKGVFTKHFLQQDDPDRIERHALGDIDGDGFPDLAIVKNLRGHLLWFANPAPPTPDGLWQRHVITTDLPGAYDVDLADIDGDGDLDVAASSWILGNQFAWFVNDGKPGSALWKKHVIEDGIAETRTIRAADFDGDGDPDLLGTALGPGEVLVYENRRSASDGVTWKKHVIARAPRPVHGQPVDIDLDGDLDVVMAMGMALPEAEPDTHRVVWYENPGNLGVDPWVCHVITHGFQDAFEAVAADLDGDGDIDVAATSWRTPGRVVWIENQGDPRGRWERHTLKKDWRSANQIIIADLNNDGRPDLAACAERGSNELRWWRNDGIRPRAQTTP